MFEICPLLCFLFCNGTDRCAHLWLFLIPLRAVLHVRAGAQRYLPFQGKKRNPERCAVIRTDEWCGSSRTSLRTCSCNGNRKVCDSKITLFTFPQWHTSLISESRNTLQHDTIAALPARVPINKLAQRLTDLSARRQFYECLAYCEFLASHRCATVNETLWTVSVEMLQRCPREQWNHPACGL